MRYLFKPKPNSNEEALFREETVGSNKELELKVISLITAQSLYCRIVAARTLKIDTLLLESPDVYDVLECALATYIEQFGEIVLVSKDERWKLINEVDQKHAKILELEEKLEKLTKKKEK